VVCPWKEEDVRTVESLLGELQMLLEAGLQEAGEGIVARSEALVAAHLLARPVSDLDHACQFFTNGLSLTHALDYLAERVSEKRGFEISGYDEEGFEGFFLKVPVRRVPILVGPDQRRDVRLEFWALHRGEGLLVRTESSYQDGMQLKCWSREAGEAFRFVEELDKAVDGCALVHGKALRLRDKGYTFLVLRPPRVAPRQAPEGEAAAETVVSFLAEGEPGEHLGTLWHGPPGNGKTSLVRRLLRETEAVTRLWVDPSAMSYENLEDTLALLARILRSLDGTDAALVVFEDIDLVSGRRDSSAIRTWLSALDGVEQYQCRVAFLGLTNLSPREFDPAVVRPARLGDLVVEFGPPDRERRRLILADHLEDRLDPHGLDFLADRSQGFSGAEVELLCRRVRWAQRKSGGDIDDRLEDLVSEVRPRPAGPALGFLKETRG
jgi:hypothetical protein